jgi:hypothetical protein
MADSCINQYSLSAVGGCIDIGIRSCMINARNISTGTSTGSMPAISLIPITALSPTKHMLNYRYLIDS